MSRLKVVSYDLETTGFVPGKNDILEIGAISYYPDSGDRKEFSVLVSVRSIHPIVSSLTGITLQTLKEEGSLPVEEAVRAFYDFVWAGGERVLIVGHNIRKFDNKFLNLELKKAGLPVIEENACWDTLQRMKKEISTRNGSRRRAPKVNLLAACKHYGVYAHEPRHRALADAKSSFNIYRVQRARSRTAPTLVAVGKQGKQR